MKPSIKNLFTLSASNAGINLPIPLPNGKPSGCSMTVLGADSDVFRQARVERTREGPRILALPEDQRPDAIRVADVHFLSSIVTGWDFPDSFSREAVKEAFVEAPHIFDYVNEAITERGRFFDEKSIPSSSTPNGSFD